MSLLENCIELGPSIILIENAIDNSDEVIQKAIEKSEKDGIENAQVYNVLSNKEENFLTRNTQTIDIKPSFRDDVFWWILAQKIWQYGESYAYKYNAPFTLMENPQLLWYKKNEGFYVPHMDSGIPAPRMFSAVLYLNDVAEGGETHFEHFNISVKPKKNSLLLFPANFAYLHGAKIPLSNDKFVVVTWFAM